MDQAKLVPLPRGGRKDDSWRPRRPRHRSQQAAEHAANDARCEMLVRRRDLARLPPCADFAQDGQDDAEDELRGGQQYRQPGDPRIDCIQVVMLHRVQKRIEVDGLGNIEGRCGVAAARTKRAERGVGEFRNRSDRVSVGDKRRQVPQPIDLALGVDATAITALRHYRLVASFPGAQRVHAQARHPRHRADRKLRRHAQADLVSIATASWNCVSMRPCYVMDRQ